MPKPRELLPKYIPEWLKRRVGVNVYHLYDFVERVGSSLEPEALVLDAGAGEGRFGPELMHARYVDVDLAVGDVAWDCAGLDVISNLVCLPFWEGLFDAVVCGQILEHVPRDQPPPSCL